MYREQRNQYRGKWRVHLNFEMFLKERLNFEFLNSVKMVTCFYLLFVNVIAARSSNPISSVFIGIYRTRPLRWSASGFHRGFSPGETVEETIANTKDAIELHISSLREDKEEIPVDDEFIISRVRVETVAG
jgi:hypothetical protein